MKIPYLGAIKLYWCDQCNLPLIDSGNCNICNTRGTKISITPPGDVRPAFEKDFKILITAVNSQFGEPIGNILFENSRIVLLNRVSGLDRMDEVILNGQTIGIIMYDIKKKKFEFHPWQVGGELIIAIQEFLQLSPKRQIELNDDGLPFILKGKSILAPGVKNYTADIHEKDYILITYRKNPNSYRTCVAIGLSQADSQKFKLMLEENYGFFAKNKKHRKNWNLDINTFYSHQLNLQKYRNFQKKKFSIDNNQIILNLKQVYKANKHLIKREVNAAKKFIQNTVDSFDKKVAVAYSGGKDSLATLKLVVDTLGRNFKIFFADTGLELPEVLENIHKVTRQLEMEDHLILKNAGNTFWEIVDSFGPPGRDYRFCCHSLKAQQITSIINNIYEGEKVLVFLGQRQYESLNRARSKKVYTNSFIPLQIAATPIKTWNSLLLWLFILHYPIKDLESKKKIQLPVTPLYFQGHERLGCYLCPASDIASFHLLKETHPNLYSKWFEFLERYRQNYRLPEEWIELGLWRFKKLPKQWLDLIKELDVSIKTTTLDPSAPLKFHLTKGFSPCLQDGYSIKGKFSEPLKIEEIIPYLPSLIKNFDWDEELNLITMKSIWKGKKFRLNLFADGSVFLLSPNQEFEVKNFLQYFIGVIFRARYCNQCLTCLSICPQEAISTSEIGIKIDPESCIQCKKCISHCPFFQSAKKKVISLQKGN